MGNSPSFGLGVRETHSSRDVRMRDPEKEVERSRASRAPTHNEYVELPASSEPHKFTGSRAKYIMQQPAVARIIYSPQDFGLKKRCLLRN